jgi:hypothetical protein
MRWLLAIILGVLFLNVVGAQQCVVYDDFSSGVLNTSLWEIRQDVENQPLMEEYGVFDEGNGFAFHTQQNTSTDQRTYLFPKVNFTTGDSFSYYVDLISSSGNYAQMTLLTGDQYIRFGMRGPAAGFDEIGVAFMNLTFEENNLHIERITPSNITIIDNLALTSSNGSYQLYVGSFSNGAVHMDFDNFILCTNVSNNISNSSQNATLDERVSSLEDWRVIIDAWKLIVDPRLSDLSFILDLHSAWLDDHESRIEALEQAQQPFIIIHNGSANFFKYLNQNDRRRIVCGYAEDAHLTDVIDNELNWQCTLKYHNSSLGEQATCRCKKIV